MEIKYIDKINLFGFTDVLPLICLVVIVLLQNESCQEEKCFTVQYLYA